METNKTEKKRKIQGLTTALANCIASYTSQDSYIKRHRIIESEKTNSNLQNDKKDFVPIFQTKFYALSSKFKASYFDRYLYSMVPKWEHYRVLKNTVHPDSDYVITVPYSSKKKTDTVYLQSDKDPVHKTRKVCALESKMNLAELLTLTDLRQNLSTPKNLNENNVIQTYEENRPEEFWSYSITECADSENYVLYTLYINLSRVHSTMPAKDIVFRNVFDRHLHIIQTQLFAEIFSSNGKLNPLDNTTAELIKVVTSNTALSCYNIERTLQTGIKPLTAQQVKPSLVAKLRKFAREHLKTQLFLFQENAVCWMHTVEKYIVRKRYEIPFFVDLDKLSTQLLESMPKYQNSKVTGSEKYTQKKKILYDFFNNVFYKTDEFRPVETIAIHGGMLCDETGLGKTLDILTLIAFSYSLKTKKYIYCGCTLVVCPDQICKHWKDEYELHFMIQQFLNVKCLNNDNTTSEFLENFQPELGFSVETHSKKEEEYWPYRYKRYDFCKSKPYIVVCPYTVFSSYKQQLLKIFWERVVIDEAAELCNELKTSFFSVRSVWLVSGMPHSNENTASNLLLYRPIFASFPGLHWFNDLCKFVHSKSCSFTQKEKHLFDENAEVITISHSQTKKGHITCLENTPQQLVHTIGTWLWTRFIWREINIPHNFLGAIIDITEEIEPTKIEKQLYQEIIKKKPLTYETIRELQLLCAYPQTCKEFVLSKTRFDFTGKNSGLIIMKKIRDKLIQMQKKKVECLTNEINVLKQNEHANETVIAQLCSMIPSIESLTNINKPQQNLQISTNEVNTEVDNEVNEAIDELLFLNPSNLVLGNTSNPPLEKNNFLTKYNKFITEMTSIQEKAKSRLHNLTKELNNINANLSYLETSFLDSNNTENLVCIICLRNISSSITVVSCGHSYDTDCIIPWLKRKNECPHCKKKIDTTELYHSDITLGWRLLHGSKMGYIINFILFQLPAKRPEEKVILFSQFDFILDDIHTTLQKNNICSVICSGNIEERQNSIEQFQTNSDCKVILLSPHRCAPGTNLTKATRIFLLDPIIDKSTNITKLEKRVISRTYRLGQQNDVRVIRLLLKNTFEYDISNLRFSEHNISEEVQYQLILKKLQKTCALSRIEPESCIVHNYSSKEVDIELTSSNSESESESSSELSTSE